MTPTEADKDLVLIIKSARGEYTGNRIMRINPNDFTLQVTKGGASNDVMIPFTEVRKYVKHRTLEASRIAGYCGVCVKVCGRGPTATLP